MAWFDLNNLVCPLKTCVQLPSPSVGPSQQQTLVIEGYTCMELSSAKIALRRDCSRAEKHGKDCSTMKYVYGSVI